MMIMKRAAVGLSVAVLVLALLVGALVLSPARVDAQNTACFKPAGGASYICGDGGSFVVQDGGSLVVESGATLAISGYTTSTMESLTVTGASALATVGATAVTATGLIVNGNAHITGTGLIDGATNIGGNLAVTGTLRTVGVATLPTLGFTNGTGTAITATTATLGAVGFTTANGNTITATNAALGTLALTAGTSDAFTATSLVGGTTVLTTLDVSGATNIDDNVLITGTLGANGLATLGSLQVSANADVVGNLEVTDHIAASAELYLIPPTAQTVTNGGTITGTAAVIELTSVGEVTATMVQPTDGQLLILVNTGAQTINISEDGTTKLATAAVLTADDTLTLIGVGVTWYEVARSGN